jgi:1,3-beta-glucan synthase component
MLQPKRDPPITIVGFREHIFTGSVSSLANYMALQELSFVTIGQRVLEYPLRIRMHYGHPDLFDKVGCANNTQKAACLPSCVCKQLQTRCSHCYCHGFCRHQSARMPRNQTMH